MCFLLECFPIVRQQRFSKTTELPKDMMWMVNNGYGNGIQHFLKATRGLLFVFFFFFLIFLHWSKNKIHTHKKHLSCLKISWPEDLVDGYIYRDSIYRGWGRGKKKKNQTKKKMLLLALDWQNKSCYGFILFLNHKLICWISRWFSCIWSLVMTKCCWDACEYLVPPPWSFDTMNSEGLGQSSSLKEKEP